MNRYTLDHREEPDAINEAGRHAQYRGDPRRAPDGYSTAQEVAWEAGWDFSAREICDEVGDKWSAEASALGGSHYLVRDGEHFWVVDYDGLLSMAEGGLPCPVDPNRVPDFEQAALPFDFIEVSTLLDLVFRHPAAGSLSDERPEGGGIYVTIADGWSHPDEGDPLAMTADDEAGAWSLLCGAVRA